MANRTILAAFPENTSRLPGPCPYSRHDQPATRMRLAKLIVDIATAEIEDMKPAPISWVGNGGLKAGTRGGP